MSDSTRGTALVTGASRGIGRAIALQLAEDGYDVAFCSRSESDASREVHQQVLLRNRRAFHQACNVADFDSVQAFVRASEEQLGPITALVNCAGIVRDNPLVLMRSEAWQEVIDVNLTGTFNVCRSLVFNFMKQKRGVIVNLSSVAGVYGNATQSNYAATKAGIIGFSKSLSKELAPYGIRVNVVAPGFIRTDMTSNLDPKAQQKALAMIPLRRMGEAEEVAYLTSFLLSDRAAYITGQTFQVDGGITI